MSQNTDNHRIPLHAWTPTGVVLLIVVAMAVYDVQNPFLDILRSATWQPAMGEVLSVGREINETDDGVSYRAQVVYRYTIDGRTFEGNRVYFGGFIYGSPDSTSRILDRYSPGDTVTVYANPNNPSEAVLERRLGSFLLGVGIIVVVLMLWPFRTQIVRRIPIKAN